MSGILHHHVAPVRVTARRASAAAAAAALAVALTVAACSSSASQASASSLAGNTTQQACTTIADILSSGPDPDADSVGYAEAQVLPLRQLKITNATLARYVTALADAYQAHSSGSAPGGSAAAVTKAENDVNTICPEAAP